VTIAMMTVGVIKKFGPDISKWIDSEMDKEEETMTQSVRDEFTARDDAIKNEEMVQVQLTNTVKNLHEARRENVALQLETAFRSYQLQAFNEVKKRLDYQLEVVNLERRMQQKHMVDWVVSNVLKGISAKQEKDTLAKCISDLKGLAATA